MIKDIGRFVLNEATRQLGIWQRAFRPSEPVFMAVNVSASQLMDADLVDDIKAAVTRETVYRQTLKIEVTESAVMQYPEKSASLLELVKQTGRWPGLRRLRNRLFIALKPAPFAF